MTPLFWTILIIVIVVLLIILFCEPTAFLFIGDLLSIFFD